MNLVLEKASAVPVFFIIAKTMKFPLVSFRLMLKKNMTVPSVTLSGATDEPRPS